MVKAKKKIEKAAITPYERWSNEIGNYERIATQWQNKSKKIIRRFKDERGNADRYSTRYNILWSNIQTIRPAVYSRDPKVMVERRFKDEDPIGREVSDVIERATSFEQGCHQFGDLMRQAITDRLLPGRGTVWIRYQPHFKQGPQPDESAEEGQITDDAASVLDYEEAIPDYVHWKDFGHTIARTWEECQAVWRITYLSKDELAERFGEKLAKIIPLDQTPEQPINEQTADYEKKAAIYEIWEKQGKTAIWLSKSYPELLDQRDDPLRLDDFFPCPRPLYATLANDSLIPIPDYVEYQDQANELDLLTARINAITRAIKVAGVYDASSEGIARIFAEGIENQLVPIDSAALFGDKGGLSGVMQLVPMEEIVATLMSLYEARDHVKNDLYEITGLADIIRGNSDPTETATAQQIKGRFASLRLNELQSDVQRFAKDILAKMGEVICLHFEPETLMKMTGKHYFQTQQEKQQVQQQLQISAQQAQQSGQPPQEPPPEILEQLSLPTWEEIIGRMRDKPLRQFTIDIETDSTVSVDEDADKQGRMEFINTVAGFLQQAVTATQTVPQLGPLIGEMLSFLVRGFPQGRQLENAINQATKAIAAAPPQPDPKAAEAQAKQQADMQKAQMQQETDQKKAQLDQQTAYQKAELDAKTTLERERIIQQGETDRERMRHGYENQRLGLPPIDSMAANHDQLTQALTDLGNHLKAPKRVIRDKSGRMTGVEVVQ